MTRLQPNRARAQMALGRDGAHYVTEAAGKLTRVNLADGTKTEVAS